MLIKQVFDRKKHSFYTRYVDDILLIYNSKCITPEIIHNYVNQTHTHIQFIPTHENNNTIRFLDLLIIRNPTNLEIDIYRKQTHNDRYHSQLPFQPPNRTQNSSIPLPHQQNAVTSTNRRKTTSRMGGNKNHSTEQQFPDQIHSKDKNKDAAQNSHKNG